MDFTKQYQPIERIFKLVQAQEKPVEIPTDLMVINQTSVSEALNKLKYKTGPGWFKVFE